MRLKKRNGTNFKSIHVLSELSLMKGNKVFEEQKYSIHEQSILKRKFNRSEPGNLMMLGEIY